MYQRKSKGWVKHLDFIVLDIIALQTSFIIAYMLRHGYANPYASTLYRDMGIYLVFIDVLVALVLGTFTGVLKKGYYKELTNTVKHVLVVELVSIMYLFTVKSGGEYSRLVLYMTGGVYLILSYTTRVLWKEHLKRTSDGGSGKTLLVITDSEHAEKALSTLTDHNYERFRIVGMVVTDCDRTGEEISGVPVVSDVDGAAEYVCHEWIDEVMVVQSENEHQAELLHKLSETGVTIHVGLISLSMDDVVGRKQFVERVGGYVVVTTSPNYATAKDVFFKRTLDIAGGLVGCLVTVLLMIFAAPAIYISSPGPIFFSQDRVGKNGKKFKMYKFRSMYMDAEERKKELMAENVVQDGMMFKMEFDPRVIGNKILPDGTKKTGIGQFIRDTSLDEFPQFFNVLKGDMSLVGTRPPTLDEWDKYELHHRARLATKPGITGMWQVSGRSEITDFEEVVKLDMEYIENWSIGLDMKILLKTVGTVLNRKGSM